MQPYRKLMTHISISRAIAYDHRRYSDPEIFDPDRFFNANGGLSDDDVGYVFGFGRRRVIKALNRRSRLPTHFYSAQDLSWTAYCLIVGGWSNLYQFAAPSLYTVLFFCQVWLAIASVLQIFDIEKKRDSKGKEIPVNGGYADGLIL